VKKKVKGKWEKKNKKKISYFDAGKDAFVNSDSI
jgi:hypothetical protein